MHELLFHRQKALEDDDLRRYAGELGLDLQPSTMTGAMPRCSPGSVAMSRAEPQPETSTARRRCSSTVSCYADSYDTAALIDALARAG